MIVSPASRRRLVGLALIALSPFAVTEAAPISFLDTEFNDSDWQLVSSSVSPVSFFTVGQDTTAGRGNPSPYRLMTFTNPVDPLGGPSTFVGLNFRRLDWSYDPAVSGPIDHIDMAMDRIVFDITVNGTSISSGGVGHLFRLYQNGAFFVASDPPVFTNRTWQTISLTGLTANDFVNTLGAGQTHPDFSENGGVITFGFTRSNTNTGQSATVVTVHGIDNFAVTVTPAEIPLPGSLGLLAPGLAGVLARAKFRKRKGGVPLGSPPRCPSSP